MNDKIKKIEKILIELPFDESIGDVFKLLNEIDKELDILNMLYDNLEVVEYYGEDFLRIKDDGFAFYDENLVESLFTKLKKG